MPNKENSLELTAALLYKMNKPCCQTPCYNCPYVPAHQGLSGAEYWNPNLKTKVDEFLEANNHKLDSCHLPQAHIISDSIKAGTATRPQISDYFRLIQGL